MSADGNTVLNDEPNGLATIVRDGAFFANNKLYTINPNTGKIEQSDKEFLYTSAFSYGAAIVKEKGEPVSIINSKGETLGSSDWATEYKVDRIFPFDGKYAIFFTTDGCMGAQTMCWLLAKK